ncbi:UDP-4-amino-4,6-dideoxy-N-acetyl-beta-L-altrosamine transaminase [Asticcacaulis excentricus]|uniref:UDP-4-keto-6-deoxy-N-acetylglucosamine 4-aminotransferase n=1 Tax=Asticcacaulis excentricus (strain ATCC 15261 / DSM 4724 / KCTC 12464 / NCIMB 9791 / VKM B-1370 / CB 48) TaxID=573065 RepID=E8RQ53_ASTEC|nr:UDP-4-amino-4,6-dideoxy-N-acetyl-beta-L-altrosamine transaminase [Asticcacaulis excentricus]ADU12110.1 UDP-4-keto-6-deoxy-N-acetylglucosamine 4-aminotransferase [Asticcacaulis excentricus CB 48]
MTATPFLPYGRQSIADSDIEAVVEALRSDYLTTGPMVERFERELAATVGAKEAVVVANGTAALHLCMLAQDLTPSDVVIVPSITFAASANCVAYCGAQVVFADVDPLTGLITDETFEDALSLIGPQKRFAGVIPVHYAGRPVDISRISAVARARGAFVIEDACHALGSTGPQGPIGACAASDMANFSFHPVKTLTTGEGGAISTNDLERARRLRLLRSHGIERDPARFVGLGYGDGDENGAWVYEMQVLGFNYRLPDINCALGVAQLKRLPEFIKRRKALVAAYQAELAQSNLPVSWMAPAAGDDPVFHLFAPGIDFAAVGKTRAEVMAGLRERGIGTQVHYIPVHRQPYWQTRQLSPRALPGADAFYRSTLSLPLYPDMADGDPARVVEALKEVLA